MRLISWNVQRLAADIGTIADEIVRHRSDVVALQEYQPSARGDALDDRLAAEGFAFRQGEPVGRRFCNVVFATAPAVAMTSPNGLPAGHWSSYWVEMRCGELGMSCVHVPVNGYPGPRDAYQQTAIRHCRAQSATAHVLIGDMNSTSASDSAPNAVSDS